MNDTLKPTSEAKTGSKLPELEPWDIAILPCWEEGNTTVEFATDNQFQAYVLHNAIPHNDNGMPEWSFGDRCGVINFARSLGIVLSPVPNKNNSSIELFEGAKPAMQEVSRQ